MDQPVNHADIEKQIGFPLDREDKLNQLFLSWLDEKKNNQLDQLQIWAYHWIRRYFFKKFISFEIRSETDTEALISSAFLKFSASLCTLKRGHRLQPWVNLICKCVLLDFFKKDDNRCSFQPVETVDIEYSFIDDLIAEIDSRETVDRVFKELNGMLSEEQMKILHLKIIDQKNNRQIAEIMGCDAKTVARNSFYILRKMRNSKNIIHLLNERLDGQPVRQNDSVKKLFLFVSILMMG